MKQRELSGKSESSRNTESLTHELRARTEQWSLAGQERLMTRLAPPTPSMPVRQVAPPAQAESREHEADADPNVQPNSGRDDMAERATSAERAIGATRKEEWPQQAERSMDGRAEACHNDQQTVRTKQQLKCRPQGD